MTTLSNHVPDPRLITAFAERRDGPLHRVNPWTKVGVVGALVLAVTVFDRLALLAGLYGGVLGIYGLSGLPYRRLVGWYTLPMLFMSRYTIHKRTGAYRRQDSIFGYGKQPYKIPGRWLFKHL